MYRTVAAYPDPILAHIVRGRLEAEGIPAWIADEHTVLMSWDWRLALGGAKVRVPTELFVEAREVVRELDRGAFLIEEEEGVPACRETWSSRLAYFALLSPLMPWPLLLPWSRRKVDRVP